MSQTLNIVTVDAFTTEAFKGNPAAVVLSEKPIDECTMKKVANEINLSETAYAMPLDGLPLNESQKWSLRWLTPTTEVNLCGHATLATCHVIFSEHLNTNDTLEFETRSGSLFVSKSTTGIGYTMDFPAFEIVSANDVQGKDVIWNCAKEAAGDLTVVEVKYALVAKKVLVIVDEKHTKSEILARKVESSALMATDPTSEWVRGVCLTKRGTTEDGLNSDGLPFDCISRYFAPWVGITEDPATGSLHCALGPYWCDTLNKMELSTYQCYPKRGAQFGVKWEKDAGRVKITGQAVTVLRGAIDCPVVIKK